MTVLGRVAFWRREERWGVVASGQTPGGRWVHFSAIAMDGFRELHAGQQVDLDWEHAQQDGYHFRATSVSPHGRSSSLAPTTDSTASAAFRSFLLIESDQHLLP